MARRASRVDQNQADIITYLEGMGWEVYDTHTLAQAHGNAGFPDLLCVLRSRRHIVVLVEAKYGDAKLTKDEEEFHAKYVGFLEIVRTWANCEEMTRKYQLIQMEDWWRVRYQVRADGGDSVSPVYLGVSL